MGYLWAPQPPATRVMGKSSDYAAQYTECYQNEAKSKQGMAALIGCGIEAAVVIVYEIYVWTALTSALSGH